MYNYCVHACTCLLYTVKIDVSTTTTSAEITLNCTTCSESMLILSLIPANALMLQDFVMLCNSTMIRDSLMPDTNYTITRTVSDRSLSCSLGQFKTSIEPGKKVRLRLRITLAHYLFMSCFCTRK